MMKKLVVLMLVLAVGSMASAGLMLGADKTVANVGETVVVGIDAADQMANVAVFILLNGVGSLDVAGAGNSVGDGFIDKLLALGLNPADLGAIDGVFAELVIVAVPPVAMPNGRVVSGLKLTSDVEGVASLSVLNSDTMDVMSTLDVTFVPEPMSMILLGLGGLFLRRRN